MQAQAKEALLDAYWNLVPNTVKRPLNWMRRRWWKATNNVRYYEYEHRREFMRRVLSKRIVYPMTDCPLECLMENASSSNWQESPWA